MLVSTAKFQVAITACAEKMFEFAHFYQMWIDLRTKKKKMETEFPNDSSLKEINSRYERMTQSAVNKLMAANKIFFRKYKEYFVYRLEEFADYEQALLEVGEVIHLISGGQRSSEN